MALFLYVVVAIIGLVGFVYFDVKGIAWLGFKPRSNADSVDREMRPLAGILGVVLWPLAIVGLVVGLSYSGLVKLFSRVPKAPKIWSCPIIKPATGYRDAVARCSVKARSTKRPKCGKHHCDMVEET